MLHGAYIALKTVQEFLQRLNAVEVNDQKQDNRIEKNENQIASMKDQLQLMQREIGIAGKVQDHQAHQIELMRRQIADLEADKQKLKSEKHGLAISKGKQKAANKKLHIDIQALKSKAPSTKPKH
jgi:chromosome segregation ATPase